MLQRRRSVHHNKDVSSKVIELLSSNPQEEYNAKQISVILGIKPSSARTCLSRLVKKGAVIKPHRGRYKWADASDFGYGVGKVLPRVHNLILSCKASGYFNEGLPKEIRETIGDVNLRFLYGKKRRRITVWVSCDEGLDAREFKLCLSLIRLYILEFYGFKPAEDELEIVSYELNEDYPMRLDGVKSMTVSALGGWLERIYQKHENIVRSEVKGKQVSIEALYTLLKGGTTPYNIVQGQFMLIKKIESLAETIKFQNRINLEIRELLVNILKRFEGRCNT